MGLHRETVASRIDRLEDGIARLERRLTPAQRGVLLRLQAAGVDAPSRQILNFATATVEDDPVNGRTNVTFGSCIDFTYDFAGSGADFGGDFSISGSSTNYDRDSGIGRIFAGPTGPGGSDSALVTFKKSGMTSTIGSAKIRMLPEFFPTSPPSSYGLLGIGTSAITYAFVSPFVAVQVTPSMSGGDNYVLIEVIYNGSVSTLAVVLMTGNTWVDVEVSLDRSTLAARVKASWGPGAPGSASDSSTLSGSAFSSFAALAEFGGAIGEDTASTVLFSFDDYAEGHCAV